LPNILFASASLGGGCSDGAYQQIVKNMKKKFYRQIILKFAPTLNQYLSLLRGHG
jgi:hypothetical protein